MPANDWVITFYQDTRIGGNFSDISRGGRYYQDRREDLGFERINLSSLNGCLCHWDHTFSPPLRENIIPSFIPSSSIRILYFLMKSCHIFPHLREYRPNLFGCRTLTPNINYSFPPTDAVWPIEIPQQMVLLLKPAHLFIIRQTPAYLGIIPVNVPWTFSNDISFLNESSKTVLHSFMWEKELQMQV